MSDRRADGAIPSVGNLKQVSLACLFEEAHARRLTGAIHFQAGEKKKTILFEDAMVIGARSNLLAERLGQVLVRMGKMDAAACGDTLSLQRTRRENIGDLAMDLGLVAEEDLQEGLRRQAKERIGELFRWQEGSYAIVTVDPGAAKGAVIRISAAEAVLVGLRLGYDAARLRAILAPLARKIPVVISTTMSRLGEVRLAPREEALLRTIDGRTPLAAILGDTRADARSILPLLLGAMLVGLLEMRDAPASPAEEPPRPGGGEVRQGILDRAWVCSAKDHYAVLGLAASAPVEEIRERYLELARTVHPDRLGLDAPEELRALAQAVFARIGEAHAVLASAGSRELYDREHRGREAFERKAQEAERALQAEMQYQKGLVYLRKRSLREAVEAFGWAADLCAEEGEYRAFLGWAIHRAAIAEGRPSPPEAKDALERAIALRPEMDHAHVFLGNLRKAEGDLPGAEACYRRAVEINPDCTDARRELRMMAMRRGKGKGRGAT